MRLEGKLFREVILLQEQYIFIRLEGRLSKEVSLLL
jgi:hypothetical protein